MGEQADRIILCALVLWPSQAIVTSVKDFSSLRCLNEATMLVWKSFQRRQNCCWSSMAAGGWLTVCKGIGQDNFRPVGIVKSSNSGLGGRRGGGELRQGGVWSARGGGHCDQQGQQDLFSGWKYICEINFFRNHRFVHRPQLWLYHKLRC